MKAEELMIGDWVYDTILMGYTKVELLSMSGIRGDSHESVYNEKTFEPIPLTPGILEKNGFEKVLDKDKLPTYRIKWTRNPNLYFTVFTGVDCYWNPVGYGVTIAGVNGVIDYVHQLQHALKLCGINKEIVL